MINAIIAVFISAWYTYQIKETTHYFKYTLSDNYIDASNYTWIN